MVIISMSWAIVVAQDIEEEEEEENNHCIHTMTTTRKLEITKYLNREEDICWKEEVRGDREKDFRKEEEERKIKERINLNTW